MPVLAVVLLTLCTAGRTSTADVASAATLPPQYAVTTAYLVGANGDVFGPFGTTNPVRASGQPTLDPVVAAASACCDSYIVATRSGRVFPVGDFQADGDASSLDLVAPISGATALDSGGYWLTAGDGGVFAFGDASYYGGMAGHRLAGSITGIAAIPSGYWLVGADGGVFAFGNAPFLGSLPSVGIVPQAPIVGIGVTQDGEGYWLVGSDGGVFAFGDAQYQGSLPGEHTVPREPIVAIVPTNPNGVTHGGTEYGVDGYTLVGADGAVYPFSGDGIASLVGQALAAPIVAAPPFYSACTFPGACLPPIVPPGG